MNRNFNRAAFAGVLCLTLAGAAAATAQDRQPGPAGAHAGPRAAEHHRMFEEFRQRRETRLHDLLQIKPAQEGAFKTFLTAVERKHKDGERGPRAEPPKPMTTPERLDRQTARLGQMQQRIAATRVFYAALSPEQKKAFDELGPMMGRRHGMHGHHGFEGRGHWGHGGPDGHDKGGADGVQGPPPPR